MIITKEQEKELKKIKIWGETQNKKQRDVEEFIKNKMNIQEKLIKFEKYIKRVKFNYADAKSNMLFRFHEIFLEEMKGSETGTKFRRKCGI